MNLQDIESFVCLAECLSFTEAARCLYISQPTLSRQIADLENQLEVKLFTRSKRNVELTAAGAELLQYARDMVSNFDEFCRRAKQVSSGAVKKLSFGFPTYFDIDEIMHLFAEMPSGYFKDVDLVLNEEQVGSLMSGLDARKFDFVLMPALMLDKKSEWEIEYLNVFQTQLYAVIPENHRFSGRAKIPLSELEGETMIMLTRDQCPLEMNHLDAVCREHNVKLNVIHNANTTMMVQLYIMLGIGITVASLAPDAVLPQGLECVPLDCRREGRELETILVWRKDSLNPAVAEFVEMAKKIF